MLKTVKPEPFRLGPYDHHDRFYVVDLDRERMKQFFLLTKDIHIDMLEAVPYFRFMMAKYLLDAFGQDLRKAIVGIIRDRDAGALMIKDLNIAMQIEEQVKLATALGHLLGPACLDSSSNTYYSRSVYATHHDEINGREEFHPATLHTDGAFETEEVDWVLLMKTKVTPTGLNPRWETHWRFLHLDDWENLTEFKEHFLSSKKFLYYVNEGAKGCRTFKRKPFSETTSGSSIFFIDTLVHPTTITDAMYLKRLSDSLETSKGVTPIVWPVDAIVIFNNRFLLHGRDKSKDVPPQESSLEIIRLSGSFV